MERGIEVIDIIDHIAELLAPLNAQIEQSFPNTSITLPLIVLTTISDVAETNGNIEYFTRLSVQIDAYTNDKDDTFALYGQIDDIMTANGFTRSNAFPLTEGTFERYQMTYKCNIDASHTRIMV